MLKKVVAEFANQYSASTRDRRRMTLGLWPSPGGFSPQRLNKVEILFRVHSWAGKYGGTELRRGSIVVDTDIMENQPWGHIKEAVPRNIQGACCSIFCAKITVMIARGKHVGPRIHQ